MAAAQHARSVATSKWQSQSHAYPNSRSLTHTYTDSQSHPNSNRRVLCRSMERYHRVHGRHGSQRREQQLRRGLLDAKSKPDGGGKQRSCRKRRSVESACVLHGPQSNPDPQTHTDSKPNANTSRQLACKLSLRRFQRCNGQRKL